MFSSQIQHKYHLSSVFSHLIVLCMKYRRFVLYSLRLLYCIAIFFFIYWHIPASFHRPERITGVEKCNGFCGCRQCLRAKSVRESFGGPTRRWPHRTSAAPAAEASAGPWVSGAVQRVWGWYPSLSVPWPLTDMVQALQVQGSLWRDVAKSSVGMSSLSPEL